MSSAYSIAVLAGDGVGPEVIEQAVRALEKVGPVLRKPLAFSRHPAGGAAIDAEGSPLPEPTLQACLKSDAVLKGPWGGPKWDLLPTDKRPERGILRLRKALDAFANLRPSRIYPSLVSASPLRPELASRCDFLIVRELVAGLYFGEPRGIEGKPGSRRGFNTLSYTEDEVSRVVKLAFEMARLRRKKVCSVHKANVLESMRLWLEVSNEVAKAYPDVAYKDMIVDACSMEILRDPGQFDVMVMENTFGDILSDEAAAVTGSLGLAPSASLGDGSHPGLFEPVHGSAPDIAGQGKANPLGAILTASMLLRFGLKEEKAADLLEKAVGRVLESGLRTPDLAKPGEKSVTTSVMGEAVLVEIHRSLSP